VCRGMPSCPWGSRGGSPGRGLVGFLWGTPRPSPAHVAGQSETWDSSFRGADPRLGPRDWPAVDSPGYLDSRRRLISGAPDRDSQLTRSLLSR